MHMRRGFAEGGVSVRMVLDADDQVGILLVENMVREASCYRWDLPTAWTWKHPGRTDISWRRFKS